MCTEQFQKVGQKISRWNTTLALSPLQVPSGLPFNCQEELVGTRAWCGDASCKGTIIFCALWKQQYQRCAIAVIGSQASVSKFGLCSWKNREKKTLYCNNLKFYFETWCELRRSWVFLMWWMQANRCPRTLLHCCCRSNVCSSNWNDAVTGFTHSQWNKHANGGCVLCVWRGWHL